MDPRVTAALKVENEKYSAGTIGGEKYVNLRDEFAKQAMQEFKWLPGTREQCAVECYKVADAMLAARNA